MVLLIGTCVQVAVRGSILDFKDWTPCLRFNKGFNFVDTQAAAAALTSLGHVYTAIGDYPNALASHKQCVQLVKQMGDRLQEAREIGNVGAVYLAMGEFDSAVDCHTQHLRLARRLGDQVEEARAYSNLGSSYHYRRNFSQAIAYHENVLRIAQNLGDRAIEARAYAGLGHAARCGGDYAQAKKWHERQLDVALVARDKVGEGRACSNLGIVYQLLGEHDAALKLHQAHLSIARQLQDKAGMGRAYGNIGNAYSAAGFYEQAIKYHKQELTISKEVHDRSSEASTHGNLAVAYQALGAHDMALFHYRAHLGIARELKDAAGEACALLNLGNCLSSRGEFAQAVPYYEQHLMLSQELGDVTAEAKACHFLGYAHYCLGNYREAVRYYDQDLSLAKDLQDKMNMGRAYCNLGLAHLALGNLETALECQKYFLAIAHMTQHLQGKFRALGNIGDVLIKMGDVEEAVKMYQRQLGFARQARDRSLEAAACGALGLARRLQRRLDAALGHHTQELTLRQEAGDAAGEARAHSHLGAVHMALGHYSHAARCYREQLERAQELQDCALEAQAYGNLGIAKLNMGHYEDAIGYLEQQLAILERVNTPTCQLDKARALGSLGDCYDALGDPDEAAKYHEQHLAAALKLNNAREQERAYRGLGQSHKSVGNLQQALVCLEKRLVVSHELGVPEAKAQAYGELGALHIALGNLEQAVSCLEHQKNIAEELNNQIMESEAYHSLGVAQHALGDHAAAIRNHRAELEIAHRLGLTQLQARACGGLGAAHASMGAHAEAARWHESRLRHATAAGDTRGRAQALADLGRAHLAMGACGSSVSYLRQALAATEGLADADEEARIRHRLGFALWASGELEEAKEQLQAALNVLESGNEKHRDRKAAALYTSTQHALQRVLVELGRHSEALVVAERGRCRSLDTVNDKHLTLNQASLELHSTQRNTAEETNKERMEHWSPSTVDHILEVVNKQKAPVLYYSLAAGRLYAWLIQPHKGILRFHQVSLTEEAEDSDNSLPDISPDDLHTTGGFGKLERCISEWSVWLKTAAERRPENDDQWEPDERPNTGLARIVTRNHLLNSSNYSLSSLSSVHGTRKKQPSWQGPPCLTLLYQMLLAPFEDLLPASCNNNHASHGRRGCGGRREIVLVVEGALYACPWGALRGNTDTEPLCERYALLAAPALRPLRHKGHMRARPHHEHGAAASNSAEAGMRCLVVGAPRVGGTRWASVHAQLKEAELVADMLRVTALTDYQASKEAVLMQLSQAECIHFATHVCWKTPAIVLSPGEVVDSQAKRLLNTSVGSGAADTSTENEEENAELPPSNEELPPASEFMLTASEIMNLKITARLVVISCAPSSAAIHGSEDEDVSTAGDGVSRLCRALLTAGAQAILLTLWPAPQDTATKILYRALYSALLQGSRVAKALGDAMQTVRHTKHFAHPAHWSGLVLLGANVRLSNKVALMGQALCELMAQPDKCRDALRVCLHLVEKSLQRIVRGQKNAMYTTQKSIENKAGNATGWKELLMSVGFRFEPAANGIPSSVFFPQSDPEERLTQCSASLQALLGLTPTTLQALSKLIANGDVADDIIGVIRSVISQFSVNNSETDTIEVAVNVRLWRVNGCHELLASLGFDLAEVGQDEVTLRTGKQANRRHIQFVLQALLALFDTQEAPRSLSLESSSSVESLASIDDGDLEPHSDGEPPPRQHRQESVSSVPPPPLPLGSCGGAFTMYVRGSSASSEVGRGEPDGRTAPPPAPPPPRYRGESDAAFTPSPPAAPQQPNAAPPRDVSLALAHQTKIRTLYTRRPPSTDDSDWESSGHDTVLRRRPEHPHQRYLDAFYDLASAQPRRAEEEKPELSQLNQPSTSKRVPRPKMGTSSRDSMAQVRHMSGELTPTISEVYHERNIGLGLAPPLAELLLAEESKTEIRAASSSENLLLQNLEKLGLLGDAGENEERWCSGNASRPWLSAPPLETDVQGSDLTTAEIIERQTKFKKDEPKRKEENAYELKPKEETPGPSGIEKRSVSPFSELSRRDEGDGRSIADSHSSYKALVLSPRTPYLPEEVEPGKTGGIEGGKTHPRVRRPPVPRTRPAYTTLDFPANKNNGYQE
ncbi:tetratricopeptide repeat domain-containing protein [Phthorimaea operculella]|nr:tetratricopeptide repeat domain-containing protein [Phthorimaea operculella]